MNSSGERRFVVLRHTVGPALSRTTDDHLDWMFETDGNVLRTFATAVADLTGDVDVAFEALSDHDPRYLFREGKLSGDRGYVRRIASGTFTRSPAFDDSRMRLRFEDGSEAILSFDQSRRTLRLRRGGSRSPGR